MPSKLSAKSFSFSDIINKLKPKKSGRSRLISREINLVPDVKDEMIKTLKLRNFIFFLCIIVASGSLAVIVIFASIAGGQQAIVDGKKNTINNMSTKLNSYSDLSDFLTIKDQLGNLSAISDNKKLLSRTFGILSALIPTGADTITISELAINLTAESPTFTFDAQANAGNPPYIDYNVLDSFKKSMQYMRYDYGTYVDKEGAELPAYCIIENGTDGATFVDENKGIYAYWLITGEGCHPSYEEEEEEDEDTSDSDLDSGSNSNSNSGSVTDSESTTDSSSTNATTDRLAKITAGYTTETYNGQTVVRIWRTPQYSDWYKSEEREGEPYMSLDGDIINVAHFNSACITYSGTEDEETGRVTWSTANDSCLLVPEGTDGIIISDSSNGRGSSDELVLRFSAVISLAPEAFSFNNFHFLAIAPTGRYNVTDSYVQIQNMFGERAADCAPGDTACNASVGGN